MGAGWRLVVGFALLAVLSAAYGDMQVGWRRRRHGSRGHNRCGADMFWFVNDL